MPNEELNVWLNLKDKMSRPLKGVGRVVQKFKQHWLGVTAALIAAVYAFQKVTRAITGFYKSVLKANSTIEDMGVKLKVLLGSQEEGAKAFANMRDLASEVPFEFEKIMESATDLAGVVEGGNKELEQLMPIIADIAAGTGMKVQEVTAQMIRMYSAGAAAADMFRERGVTQALGFEAGVSYSAKETMKVITKAWEEGTAKYVGATEELKDTWTGTMSMMKDAWFNFKKDVGEDFFKDIQLDLKALYKIVQDSKKEGGEYAEVVKDIKKLLVEGYEAGRDFLLWMIHGAGQALKVWHSLGVSVATVQKGITWAILQGKEIREKTLKSNLKQFQDLNEAQLKALGGQERVNRRTEEYKEQLQEVKSEIAHTKGMLEGFDKVIKDHFEGMDDNAILKTWRDFKKLLGDIETEAKKLSQELAKEGTIKNIEESLFGKKEGKENEFTITWEQTAQKIRETIGSLQEDYKGFYAYIASATRSLAKTMEKEMGNFFYKAFKGQLEDASDAFAAFGDAILKQFSQLLAKMAVAGPSGKGGIFGAVMSGLGALTPTTVANVGGYAVKTGGLLGGGNVAPASATPNGMQSGGDIGRTGQYLLHKGEEVIPKNEAEGKNVTYNIYAVDPQSFQRLLYQNKASIDVLVSNSVERNSPLREAIKQHTR